MDDEGDPKAHDPEDDLDLTSLQLVSDISVGSGRGGGSALAKRWAGDAEMRSIQEVAPSWQS